MAEFGTGQNKSSDCYQSYLEDTKSGFLMTIIQASSYSSFGVSEIQSFIALVNREEILFLNCTSPC